MGKKPVKPKPQRSPMELIVLGAAVIILAVLVAYGPAMHGDFLWDDDDYVTENPLLTDPDGLARIWFSTDSPSQYFPLVYTTFRFERTLWGLNPLGYHLTNIFLHIANALLVWLILSRLKIPGAWLGAAVFALHPVHVESVAWITERKNVLSTLFFLLTLLVSLKFMDEIPERRKYYALGLGFCALALFSKTTACTLPAAILIIVWLRGRRVGVPEIWRVAPFAGMGIVMGLVSIWWEQNKQGTTGGEFTMQAAERLLVAGRSLWFYLGKLAWPSSPAFSYPKWNIDPGSAHQYLWVIACIVAGWLLWRFRAKIGNGPILAAGFFAATLSPMLGFIPLYTFRYTYVADHYQYAASLGPIALFAAVISRRWTQKNLDIGIRLVLPAIILIVLGALTWRQSHAYADAEALWRDTLAKNPNSILANNNLGIILDEQGRIEEAVAYYQAAVRAKSDLLEAHLNLGVVFTKLGDFESAFEHLTKAVRIEPRSHAAYYDLGVCLGQWGRRDEAAAQYRKAIEVFPDYAEAHDNLGVIMVAERRFDEAVYHFREALNIKPSSGQTHNNLAVAYLNKGMYAEAWAEVALARKYGFEPHPRFLQLLTELSGL